MGRGEKAGADRSGHVEWWCLRLVCSCEPNTHLTFFLCALQRHHRPYTMAGNIKAKIQLLEKQIQDGTDLNACATLLRELKVSEAAAVLLF